MGSKEKPKIGCVCLATSARGALIFIPGSDTFAYCGIRGDSRSSAASAIALMRSAQDQRDFAEFEARRTVHERRLDVLGVTRGPCVDCTC